MNINYRYIYFFFEIKKSFLILLLKLFRRVRVVDDPVPLAVLPGMRHVGLPVVLLKGQYYSQLATPMGDAEELNALLPGSRPLLDAQHHLDELRFGFFFEFF